MGMSDLSRWQEEVVMPHGVVKWFDARKGFGFIKELESGEDVFVHYSSIEGEGFRRLQDGERVEYELIESAKGPQAKNVRRVELAPSSD
jgi:CspA family cold shock protein